MRIENTNSVQQFSAVNAFKSAKTVKPHEQTDIQVEAPAAETKNAKNLLADINVNEIRECAKTVGEYNITDEDIKYGLMYGRSVIAEYLC